MKFFGFPGQHWHFENMLRARSPDRDQKFIGIERDERIFAAASENIPWKVAKGRRRYSGRPTVVTDLASLTHVNLFTMVKRASSLDPHMTGWTCAWLDFCSQITRRMLTSLSLIHRFCERGPIPVGVTFMVGRESEEGVMDVHGSLEKRVEKIVSAMYRPFKMEKYGKYLSGKHCPMGYVLGILK
jgi:hypothetical protein